MDECFPCCPTLSLFTNIRDDQQNAKVLILFFILFLFYFRIGFLFSNSRLENQIFLKNPIPKKLNSAIKGN